MDVAASDVALAGTFEGISGNPVRRRRTHSEYVIESFHFSDFSDRGMCGCAIMAESDTAAMVTLISGTLVRRGSTHSARVTEFLQFSCSRSSCRRSRLPGWVGGKIFPHRLGPAPQWSPGAGGKILPRVRPAQGAAAVRGRSVPSFRCGRGAALRTCKGSCRGMQFVCWFSGCRQGAIILDLPGQVIHSRTNMPGSQPAWDGVQDCRWGVYFLVCALWVIMFVVGLAAIRHARWTLRGSGWRTSCFFFAQRQFLGTWVLDGDPETCFGGVCAVPKASVFMLCEGLESRGGGSAGAWCVAWFPRRRGGVGLRDLVYHSLLLSSWASFLESSCW